MTPRLSPFVCLCVCVCVLPFTAGFCHGGWLRRPTTAFVMGAGYAAPRHRPSALMHLAVIDLFV